MNDEYDFNDDAVAVEEPPPKLHGHQPCPQVLEHSEGKTATRCQSCVGTGEVVCTSFRRCDPCLKNPARRNGKACTNTLWCPACDGIGYHGIDATLPTLCQRGSAGKTAVLAARYRAGARMFQPGDFQGVME